MQVDPCKVLRHAVETRQPQLLTRRGRGIAVVQAVTGHEAAEGEREFIRAAIAGLEDIRCCCAEQTAPAIGESSAAKTFPRIEVSETHPDLG
jgi:hypothetical protein